MLEGKSFPVLGVGGGTLTLGGLWTRKSNSNENSCDLISRAGGEKKKKQAEQIERDLKFASLLLCFSSLCLCLTYLLCLPPFSLPPVTFPVCVCNSATPVQQGIAVTPGNKAADLALRSRKLAPGQGWKIYTRLHNIAYLYLRWTLRRPGSCEQTELEGGSLCVINWLCLCASVCVCVGYECMNASCDSCLLAASAGLRLFDSQAELQ